MTVFRPRFAVALVLASLACLPSAWAETEEEACVAALAVAWQETAVLPPGDPSRLFAEAELRTAETEMNAGEPEECEPSIERARHILQTRPYVLRPGETFGIAGAGR